LNRCTWHRSTTKGCRRSLGAIRSKGRGCFKRTRVSGRKTGSRSKSARGSKLSIQVSRLTKLHCRKECNPCRRLLICTKRQSKRLRGNNSCCTSYSDSTSMRSRRRISTRRQRTRRGREMLTSARRW
jgi:hypothetical protein